MHPYYIFLQIQSWEELLFIWSANFFVKDWQAIHLLICSSLFICFLIPFSQWLLHSCWAATKFSPSFSKNSTPQVSRYWANPLQKILHQWPVHGHQAVQVSSPHLQVDALKRRRVISKIVTHFPCSLLALPDDVLLGNWGRNTNPEVCGWKWAEVFLRVFLKKLLALSLLLKSIWFRSSCKDFNDQGWGMMLAWNKQLIKKLVTSKGLRPWSPDPFLLGLWLG